ncbi:MAG: hypothetical protein KDD08_12965 [Mangrovimonas sp.]|nr:hypothetical protein [Mangrovimonas sp.]
MLKWLTIHIIALWFLPAQDLETLRNAYKEAGQDDSKIETFEALVNNVSKEDNTVLVGYKAAALTLKAKLEKTIKSKKSTFIEGRDLLEYAINKTPDNVELRFIRLGIQENTPKILKYKDKIETDKAFLLEHYNAIASQDLKNHITSYIKQSKEFTAAEKQSINL